MPPPEKNLVPVSSGDRHQLSPFEALMASPNRLRFLAFLVIGAAPQMRLPRPSGSYDGMPALLRGLSLVGSSDSGVP